MQNQLSTFHCNWEEPLAPWWWFFFPRQKQKWQFLLGLVIYSILDWLKWKILLKGNLEHSKLLLKKKFRTFITTLKAYKKVHKTIVDLDSRCTKMLRSLEKASFLALILNEQSTRFYVTRKRCSLVHIYFHLDCCVAFVLDYCVDSCIAFI